MKKVKSLKFDICNLVITVSNHNINIKGSYRVKDRDNMRRILGLIKEYVEDYGEGIETPFDHRSINSMVREWVAHNNLYTLGYKKEQTSSVDLVSNQYWYELIGYWILSRIIL